MGGIKKRPSEKKGQVFFPWKVDKKQVFYCFPGKVYEPPIGYIGRRSKKKKREKKLPFFLKNEKNGLAKKKKRGA